MHPPHPPVTLQGTHPLTLSPTCHSTTTMTTPHPHPKPDPAGTYGKTWHTWQVDRGDPLPYGVCGLGGSHLCGWVAEMAGMTEATHCPTMGGWVGGHQSARRGC